MILINSSNQLKVDYITFLFLQHLIVDPLKKKQKTQDLSDKDYISYSCCEAGTDNVGLAVA